MITKYQIAEQVFELLKNSSVKKITVKLPAILNSVGPCINDLFYQEHVSANLPDGASLPKNAMVTYFDGLIPEKYKKVSRLRLPVNPIPLPLNMGVWHVSRTNDLSNAFIPIPKDQIALIRGEKIFSDLRGEITYTFQDRYLTFDRDLTIEPGISLLVGLILMDINTYDENTPLPLPDGMETDVVSKCYDLFAAQPQKVSIEKAGIERDTAVASYALMHVFWGKVDENKKITKTNWMIWSEKYGISRHTLLSKYNEQLEKKGRDPDPLIYSKKYLRPYFRRFENAVNMLESVSSLAFENARTELNLLKVQYEDYLK